MTKARKDKEAIDRERERERERETEIIMNESNNT